MTVLLELGGDTANGGVTEHPDAGVAPS